MTQEQPITFHPIDASKSGKNAFSLHCSAVGQSMSYCACLNRLDKVDAGTAPGDWVACKKAKASNSCLATSMRQEELLKGHSIFFVARSVFEAAVESAKTWISLWRTPDPSLGSPSTGKLAKPRVVKSAPASPGSALDAMGELGGYDAAITSAATNPSPTPKKAPVAPPRAAPAPLPSVSTGESPLAMARRLAAERKSNPNP